MEKRRPHFDLDYLKERIEVGAFRVTATALRCAARDFGCVEPSDLAEHIMRLTPRDFYKSMTTLYDHTLWQDVYRPVVRGEDAYVKLQLMNDNTVVISFKAADETNHA